MRACWCVSVSGLFGQAPLAPLACERDVRNADQGTKGDEAKHLHHLRERSAADHRPISRRQGIQVVVGTRGRIIRGISERGGLAECACVFAARRDGFGLVSPYHSFFGMEPGREPHPTYYDQRRADAPLHFDYCLVPERWAERVSAVEVGSYSERTRGEPSPNLLPALRSAPAFCARAT